LYLGRLVGRRVLPRIDRWGPEARAEVRAWLLRRLDLVKG